MPIRREHPKMGLKKCVGDLGEGDLKGKRVLTRVYLNAPMDDDNILLDSRIRDALPTIKHLIQHGARVILASHLGRPKGQKHDWKGEPLEPRLPELWKVEGVTPEYSLQPLVPRLSELLGVEIKMAKDCFGQDVDNLVNETPEGGVLLLENLKFYLEEDQFDEHFAEKLASCADLFVNEAFRISHRTQASTATLPYSWKEKAFRSRYRREEVFTISKPAVTGLLMRKELDYLIGAVKNPTKPFAAIVGGSKLSTKIHLIESLLENVGLLLLGGGIIFTFYKANGYSVGSSRVEEINLAESLIKKAKEKGVRLVLPVDVEIADRYGAKANRKVVPVDEIHDIPAGWMGLDIGPDTIKSFGEELDTAKTILWNGPMGVFEKNFAAGTKAIANKLAELTEKGVTTIIAGGDTVVAVTKVGLAGKMSHISKGGDASLELLEGKKLPGVLYLDDA